MSRSSPSPFPCPLPPTLKRFAPVFPPFALAVFFLLAGVSVGKALPDEQGSASKSVCGNTQASPEDHPSVSTDGIPFLSGPTRSDAGRLVVFETEEPADWTVTPQEDGVGCWAVDTSGRRLYFASEKTGVYTIVAAVVVNGKAVIATSHFYNGTETPRPRPEPQPDPSPQPSPSPPTLSDWAVSEAVKIDRPSAKKERLALAESFAGIAAGIERRTIKSPAAARTLFRQSWNSRSVAVSPSAPGAWSGFLDELGRRLAEETDETSDELGVMCRLYAELAAALKDVKDEEVSQ